MMVRGRRPAAPRRDVDRRLHWLWGAAVVTGIAVTAVTAGCTSAPATAPAVSTTVATVAFAAVQTPTSAAVTTTTVRSPVTTAAPRTTTSAPTQSSVSSTSTTAAVQTTTSSTDAPRLVDGLDADRVLTAVVIIEANGDVTKAIAQGYVSQAEVDAAAQAINSGTVNRFVKP